MINKTQAISLIRRARAGDQNAMGLIASTREAAKNPKNKAAVKSLKLITRLIEKNPVHSSEAAFQDDNAAPTLAPPSLIPPISNTVAPHLGVLKSAAKGGADEMSDSWCLCCVGQALINSITQGDPGLEPVMVIILARGAPLTDSRLQTMLTQCPPEAKEAMGQGMVDTNTPQAAQNVFARAGNVVGQARALQLATIPGQPLSHVSVSMGCEVGEWG